MLLSPSEFDERLKHNKLVISLIGMSGMGKTYRATQFSSRGFTHYNCDSLIEQRLQGLPSIGIAGVASWMGQPYSVGYVEREQEYLKYEGEVMDEMIQKVVETPEKNVVIDTTGSVIYLAPEILKALKKCSLIIHLQANQEVRNKLFRVYVNDPKPVIWGSSYQRLRGKSEGECLIACYPELLAYRAERYDQFADIMLPFSIARNERSPVDEFITEIKDRL